MLHNPHIPPLSFILDHNPCSAFSTLLPPQIPSHLSNTWTINLSLKTLSVEGSELNRDQDSMHFAICEYNHTKDINTQISN